MRATTLSGGRKIWLPAVENFLKSRMGESFTVKEIIAQATLVTKTYNNAYTGDRAKYNGRHVLQDNTHRKLIDAKMCPTVHQLAQGIKGHKKIGRILRKQYRGPPLMEYFWRYEDEE